MKNKNNTVLVVDDNQDIRTQLKWSLAQGQYDVHFAEDADEALKLFERHGPRVVTLDLGLPPHEDDTVEGFRCLAEMLRMDPHAKIIVITGKEEREVAMEAVSLGAYDFYPKPINQDELRIIIDRALHLRALEDENRELHAVCSRGDEFGIVGQCKEMQEVLATIRKVAGSDVPVLVLGESGTGKELVAKAIHAGSPRKDGPLVSINCGAIPENLLESEFFGHEKGAFTGASEQRKGKVEYANGGTLFLDEIGELPVALQVKLLRFLQDKTFQRVGGREDLSVDIRVVAATNVNIKQAMHKGEFREDLFYRISVVSIPLPGLKERGEDVELLANFFLKKGLSEMGEQGYRFSKAALAAMRTHTWPGNVRELENKVRRAMIMASGKLIQPADLGLEGEEHEVEYGGVPEDKTLREAREWVEREMVEAALRRHDGNVSQASKALGISRPTMYDMLKKFGINP